ncbi:MAG: hypothetical protein JWR90_4176 [Marmoricola sp.]|nr:hypothetical protein [Marmoricola sp.]
MFAKSRKEKFVEQAQDLAHDLSEAIAPHVERARDELGPRLADARDQAAPYVKDARGRLSDARDQVAPLLAGARDQAAPYVEDARSRVTKGAAAAVAAATPVVVEAQRRGELATAALKGEPVKRKGGKKKYLVFAGLLGLGAVAFSKLRGGSTESANWQTSYAPTPAPAAPAPAAPATTPGSHAADVPADSAPDGVVGATPGESLADAAEAPHGVSTPDAPAESVDVSSLEDPEKS